MAGVDHAVMRRTVGHVLAIRAATAYNRGMTMSETKDLDRSATTSLVAQDDTGIDAQTAFAHIKVGDSWRLIRLGARDMFYDETAGYVQFDAKITSKKLRVIVKLSVDDTYAVEIGRLRRRKGDLEYVILAQETGLYTDQMGAAVERLCVANS